MNIQAPQPEFLKKFLRERSTTLPSFESNMKKIFFIRSVLLIVTLSFLIPSFKFKGKKYLVSKHNLIELFSKKDLEQLVIVGGWRELIFAIKHRIGFINTSWLYIATINYCFAFRRLNFFYSIAFSKFVSNLLEMVKKSLIFIDSDGLPYQRTLCLAAQKAEFKVVCVQHGIFHFAFDGIDGSLSDINLALDEKQLNLFLDSGIPSERLKLFDSVTIGNNVAMPIKVNQDRKVILVGEGWKSHDCTKHMLYMNLLIQLKSRLRLAGVSTFFRPHPSERYSFWSYRSLFPIVLAGRSKGVLAQNIYIGATSSLLVEAAKIGAKSIQVINVLGVGASFHDYGVHQCCIEDVSSLVVKMLNEDASDEIREDVYVVRTFDLDKLISKLC